MRAPFLAFIQQLQRSLGSLGELAPICQPRVLVDEAFEFALFELQRVQLRDLVAQQFQLRVAIARLAFQLQRAIQQLEPYAVRDSDLSDGTLQAAVAIEK